MENMEYPLEELIPIVSEVSIKYSGHEHSSITYEKAQMLMEGVLYCIDLYKKDNSNALMINHISAKEAYKYGHQVVIDKTKKLHALYNEIIIDFLDYDLGCLKNTIKKAIPWFLSNYDFKFTPQETLFTPDYPILKNLDGLSGIDFVLEYMECICIEQQFLKKFDYGYVVELLLAYHSDYKELIENICEIVLQDVVRHIMLDRPLNSNDFSKKELESLENILLKKSMKEINDDVTAIIKQFTKHYYDDDDLLLEYLICCVPNVVTGLQYNLKNHSFNPF